MKGDEANFPIDVKSPFINFLQLVTIWSVKVLSFFNGRGNPLVGSRCHLHSLYQIPASHSSF